MRLRAPLCGRVRLRTLVRSRVHARARALAQLLTHEFTLLYCICLACKLMLSWDSKSTSRSVLTTLCDKFYKSTCFLAPNGSR